MCLNVFVNYMTTVKLFFFCKCGISYLCMQYLDLVQQDYLLMELHKKKLNVEQDSSFWTVQTVCQDWKTTRCHRL